MFSIHKQFWVIVPGVLSPRITIAEGEEYFVLLPFT